MKIHFLITSLLFVVGCGKPAPKVPVVNVTIRNDWTNDFEWVEFVWTGPDITCGVLASGVGATIVDVPWPDLPGAKLNVTIGKEKITRSIEISFSDVNQRVRSGQCRALKIQIKSPDEAAVNCQ